MKKPSTILWGLLLLLAAGGRLDAQLILDPQDRLYQYITVWEEKGYTGHLPLLRPYPANLLDGILAAVIEKGDPEEAAMARDYREALSVERDRTPPDKLLPSPFGFRLGNSLWTDFDQMLYDIRPTVTVQGAYFDIFSFSGFATMGFQLANGDPAPYYTRISDEGKSGGGSAVVGGLNFDGRNLGLGVIFLGTPDLYLQGGILRSSFGPFFDHGVIIGPQCPGAGHVSFSWNTDWVTVTSILLIVNPMYVEDENTGLRELTTTHNISTNPHTLSLEKYVALHTFTFYPFDWWSFGIIEAVVFGGRFNPAYLFPLQHMPYTQLLFGDQDSSYLGLFTRFRLPLDLRLDVMFYLDDMNFNKFIGGEGTLFDLNSGQNKFALQAGLTWTPRLPVLRRISFDYTMITPYTFTHNAAAVVNYLNYAHDDSGIGSLLKPNSDQFYLSLLLQPVSFLSIDFFSRFVRHGNASDGYVPGGGEGDYWDDGRDSGGTVYFYGPMRFLTQAVIEKILQIGLFAEIRIKLGFGVLVLGAGYTFEYGWDRDLIPGNDGIRNFINLKLGLDL